MTTSAAGVTRRTRQARLAGPSASIDTRVNAVRADLADAELAGRVLAPHYAAGVPMRCIVASSMLRVAPDRGAAAVSELLAGETFTVFDLVSGWAWGQCVHDRYVGWLASDALAEPQASLTHRVVALAAPVFSRPDIKSPVAVTLPINALVVGIADGEFIASDLGWLHRRHVASIAEVAADPVTVALRFVGAPYVWGGRTAGGIDCSGLTQAALLACGVACPRDSDQQRDTLGEALDFEDRRRGDLVFFPGHVGILADPDTLVHANAFWMDTVAEPISEVVKRTAVNAVRRVADPSLPTAITATCSLTDRSL